VEATFRISCSGMTRTDGQFSFASDDSLLASTAETGLFQLIFGGVLPFVDKNLPLVIDPVLSSSTYLGGSGLAGGQGNGIAADSLGNTYVTGTTGSGFPTVNPVQTTGGAFVTKLNAAGTAIISQKRNGGAS